ncbi:MAG: transposase [Deltaproteobacteria bacterium]|nr:transposase [Deltaproteobacteria bacterium]
MALRKRHTAKFKSTVAMEAIEGSRTAAEIASIHGVHPAMVSQWKKAAMEAVEAAFEGRKRSGKAEPEGFEKEQLLIQIGQLKVELDWLKKRL